MTGPLAITPLTDPALWPELDVGGGVCECGHPHNWHARGEPGPTFNYTAPCRIERCSCKAYEYSKRSLHSLIGNWRDERKVGR